MRKHLCILILLVWASGQVIAQNQATPPPEKENLKYNLNESGSHFFQVTFLNQTWLRADQSNEGTLVENKPVHNTFDIGLRRTRIQMYGQIDDHTFVYFQFGQNNFNSQYGANSNRNATNFQNRKFAAFFHDALAEYKVFKDNNKIKLGAGLTIVNGLSRFSQPGIGSIMTMDVPVFAQATVDQTDQFSRNLTVYARGQVGKIDYRVGLSDGFPIVSTGNPPPPLGRNATFTTEGHHKAYEAYFMYQFFDHESHTTPGYTTGTYLGTKKVFNLAAGIIHQKNAMWYANPRIVNRDGIVLQDTIYHAKTLWCVESFLDLPINKEKKTAVSAYLGFFDYNFGRGYLRYNGLMNPANGTGSFPVEIVAPNSQGNAYPMFGTGTVFYTQLGYLLPEKLLGKAHGQLMPYASWMHAKYERLQGLPMDVVNVGLNWLVNGHHSKITLDYQLRPTFHIDDLGLASREHNKSTLTLQYQVFF
jgi:hypothetical protein